MDMANKIQIISASAGSGKTYRLSELLEEEVRSGNVRPDAILATTFTRKAAAELQERVRTKLLGTGLATEAQQLATSRIGTVNSVCGRLLGDFAFDLGISPQQKVIEEEAATAVIKRAMSRVIDKKTNKEIWWLEQRFPGTKVREVVAEIVAKARANRLSPEKMIQCGKRSIQEFMTLLGDPAPNGAELNEELRQGLIDFIGAIDPEYDGTKATTSALAKARKLQNKMRFRRGQLPWCDWLSLAKIKTGAKSREVAATLADIAGQHDCHPDLRKEVSQLITLAFRLAGEAMAAYQQYKDERGVLDFIDQEARTLDLLEMAGPTEILAEQLDLVLVDEFQDTSPIQLAIFLKLASLAKKSVWVGDQKQSIYGFRDADPSLMDAAITGILAGEEPETLQNSWRSRPELVRSSSDIFVPSFAGQGFPEQRVRLEPAKPVLENEPAGLSPVYEQWLLDSTKKKNDCLALARAVKDFLAAGDNSIRDPHTGQKRAARGGDIAILCRAGYVCTDVAEALEQQGVEAALPRPGLLDQPEVIAILAAVRLLVDSRDSLARAELARLLDDPANHDGFLQKSLSEPFAQGFKLEVLQQLDLAREQLNMAGPLEALDLAMDTIGIRSLCQAWGRGASRLANLDSLRAYCLQYVNGCTEEGRGISPAGMLAWLTEQEDLAQAVVRGDDTIQVMTWHKAKGLEWPVTVLFQLDKVYPALPFGVGSLSDQQFNLADPLAGRWLRYWPDLYLDPSNQWAKISSGAPFHDRLQDNPATLDHQEKAKRQELRLLYVGWTRARDKVVLAGRKGFLQKGILKLLTDGNGSFLLNHPEAGKAIWAGRELDIICRLASPTAPVTRTVSLGRAYLASGPKEYPSAFISASSVLDHGQVVEIVDLGERLPLTGNPDMQLLGEAIHTFLGADDPARDRIGRLGQASNILTRWQIAANINAESLIAASDRLHSWISITWQGAKWYREYPVTLQQNDGTIMSGFIDLLLETNDRFIIIDHKSYPGNQEEARTKAASFAGQLGAYAGAVVASTGKPVLGSYIHLPLSGFCCPISFEGGNQC